MVPLLNGSVNAICQKLRVRDSERRYDESTSEAAACSRPSFQNQSPLQPWVTIKEYSPNLLHPLRGETSSDSNDMIHEEGQEVILPDGSVGQKTSNYVQWEQQTTLQDLKSMENHVNMSMDVGRKISAI